MELAVIGLGKLGLPLAALQAQYHNVTGIDLHKKTVEKVNDGITPIIETGISPLLAKVSKAGRLKATHDFGAVAKTDMSLVIVPTPSTPAGGFSTEHVLEACKHIGKALVDRKERHIVVICSTVMPGDCDGVIADTLEVFSHKFVGGPDLGLVYSPEFIALGSVIEDMQHPAMILIGASDPESAETYKQVALSVANTDDVQIMSLQSAEIAKIALNSYVTMKISFANTLGEICENTSNADAYAITQAIGLDPRIGRPYLRPGGPYGGPCFPRDNRAFAFMAENHGVDALLAKATDKINDHQIQRVVEHVRRIGRDKVCVMGFTYKPGTPNYEESFGLKLSKQLIFERYEVSGWDSMLHTRPADIPEEITWLINPEACFSNDTTTIFASPQPDLAERIPRVFQENHRTHSRIIDCWNAVPDTPWAATHVYTMGKGTQC